MSNEISPINLKILIAESLQAQRDLAKFLVQCVNKYGPVLSPDETIKGMHLMERVSTLVDRVEIALSDRRPPDKLPVYPRGGSSGANIHKKSPFRFHYRTIITTWPDPNFRGR